MSKLKGVMNWFVTIEDEAGDTDLPEEAASEDADVAAQAARKRVEAGPVGRTPKGKQVKDYVEDPYAGTIDEDAMASATPDLSDESKTFDEVYAAAGLSAAGDPSFTIYKVEKILRSEHLAGLGDKAKAASVLVTLEASGMGLDAIIQDAVARDKALDQYDQMLRRDIKNLKTDIEIQNASIEAEMQEYLEKKRKEIQSNNRKLDQARELYETWNSRKIQEEDRLFSAVSPFVDQNPITRDQE